MKSLFKVKNGRRFQTLLVKVSGDPNVLMMFTDNLNRQFPKELPQFLIKSVENKQFGHTVTSAFKWEESNEGYEFWADIAKRLPNE